jgi:drug/metabolite transporter (DMT)-like permease
VGPVFAAIAALMYPTFIALLARLWYHEKIMARAALGSFLLEISGISIYVPEGLAEIGDVSQDAWLGHLSEPFAALS